MPFEDFKGFWKVTVSDEGGCPVDSIVTFDRPDDKGPVTILCVKDPSFFYGEGTASYTSENTIEVPLEGKIYAIKMMPGNPPKIMLGPKVSGLGPAAGSWTANDYAPPGSSEPAGE